MMQNDYRRQLIMLRGIDKGLTGHVRLEKRTMIGNLLFSVGGATGGEPLYAALLRQTNGGYAGSVFGQLGRDSRGQAGLNVPFDPRNIDGYDFDRYDIVAILKEDGTGAHMAMYGFVNGSMNVDWTRLREAAAEIMGYSTAGTQPEPGQATEAAAVPMAEPVTALSEALEVIAQPEPEEQASPVILTVKAGEDGGFEDAEGNPVSIDSDKIPAGLLLDVDITNPWPETIEQLRGVFLDEPAFSPFEAEGFVFVRAPLPENAMTDHCAVGIRCENHLPAQVCYAIPGTDPLDPPPGLEEYTWVEGVHGSWWRLCLNVETGEAVEM